MMKQKTFKERVEERLEKLLYVPREKDGKLVKWNNSPMLDAVRKIFNEELEELVNTLEKTKKKLQNSQPKNMSEWLSVSTNIVALEWVISLIQGKTLRGKLNLNKEQQIELLSNPCLKCGIYHNSINALRKCQGW